MSRNPDVGPSASLFLELALRALVVCPIGLWLRCIFFFLSCGFWVYHHFGMVLGGLTAFC